MTSRISILEFRNRLKSNTKVGLLHFKRELGIFSILFPTSKCFYGKFDDTTFRLMLNSNFVSPIYIIKGKYQNINGILKLNYTVVPRSNIGFIWIKFFPLVALIGANTFCYFIFKITTSKVYIIINSFILFSLLYSRWKLKREKKNLEQKFNETFEIIIE